MQRDPQLPAPEQQRLAEQYAARALELLKDAQKAGYFKTPAHVEDLKRNRDFESLATRVDFLKLLRQIGANVVAACFIIDLPDLGGADKLRAMDVPVRTLMGFEGH